VGHLTIDFGNYHPRRFGSRFGTAHFSAKGAKAVLVRGRELHKSDI
jgi:hypothetical protein